MWFGRLIGSGTAVAALLAGCSGPSQDTAGKSPVANVAVAAAVAPARPEERLKPLEDVLHAVVAEQQYSASEIHLDLPPPQALTPAPADNGQLAAVHQELTDLRDEVAQLREELAEYMESSASDLRKENERLRKEVGRLRSEVDTAAGDRPRVPAPGDDFTEKVAQERAELPDEGEPEPVKSPKKPTGPKRPFLFTSIDEWGRTPEDAARQPKASSSLKGMVGSVPEGSGKEDLMALGRELRAKYGNYDNINIEVFDSHEAAQRYADTRAVDPEHHVLTVSKFAATGRDVILLVQGKMKVEVPLE